ncbi:unnamed protein product, partial [Meganyctiphanes norvegica]
SEKLPLDPKVQAVIISTIHDIEYQIDPEILWQTRGEPISFFDPTVDEKIRLLKKFFKGAKNANELLTYAINLKDHVNEDIFTKALEQVLQSNPRFKKPVDRNILKSVTAVLFSSGLSRREPT